MSTWGLYKFQFKLRFKIGELNELKTIEFPSTETPKDLAEGAFETEYDNGQPKFKTWVSKGCLDKYIKTYYENGRIDIELTAL